MKRIIPRVFLFLVLMVSQSVSSQNMRVAEFKHAENELMAKAGSKNARKDGNGDLSALIRVVVPAVEGFNFSGGDMYGIVGNVRHEGGVYYVYVPNQTLSLVVTHARFKPLTYVFPSSVKGGETYDMLIDLGSGQYVTLQGSRSNADLLLDGNHVGTGPIYNYYMPYGPHTVKAVAGKWEGELDFNISANDEIGERQRTLVVPMTDQSAHYGQGTVTVDGNAEIYYAGKQVGSAGLWRFDLREGVYEVETRKLNCDPARTTFVVKPGGEGNDVKAKAPSPHTGKLNIYTRPRNVIATDNGKTIDLSEEQVLPVGNHQISISRKGYITIDNLEYTIRRNEIIHDTISLERTQYVRAKTFYFGVGYTQSSLPGISGVLGLVYCNHDLQGSYTLGLGQTKQTNWSSSDGTFLGAAKHKINSFSVKYGYQIPVVKQLALTPQIGYLCNIINSTKVSGSKSYADGAVANYLSIGAKIIYAPWQHGYLFAAPEYDISFKKDKNYNAVANKAGFNVNGFLLTAGVLVNF